MIIDAIKCFSLRNSATWFQKLSGRKKRLSGNVISLRPQPKSAFGPDMVCKPDLLTPREITLLRDSTSLLVTHYHEITVHFYKKVVRLMWWNHDRFGDVVAYEKNRLLSVLLTLVERPTETSLLAFFLADNWVKYRYMSDIGDPYDKITRSLNDAVEEVLGENFTSEISAAWGKVLAPSHVFGCGLNATTSKQYQNQESTEIKNVD